MSLIILEGPDGKLVTAKADADDKLQTAGGGGGAGDASAAKQDEQTALLTTLAGTVQSALPGEFDPGVSVRIIGGTQPVAGVPPPGTPGDVVWLPQLGDNPVQDEGGANRLGVVVTDPVRQGFGDRSRPWYVASSPNGVLVQQVAIADKQDTGNNSLASIDGKLPALVGARVPVDGSGVTQPVSAAALPLPTGAATSALQGAGLPGAFTAGGGVKVGLVDALPVGANAIGSVTVSSGSITETNSSTIATNTGRIPAQGQALAAASMPVVLPLSQAGGALALDSTLTGGAAKTIARGGAKGITTAADVTSTAQGSDHQALDVQIYHGGTAKDPTQIRALTASDVVSADLRVSSAAVSHTNPVPLIVARSTHRTPGSTLPAAATSHTLSASPGTLRRVEWRYTGAGTKYIVLCDQAGGTASAANWTGWYAPMTNGSGKSYFEFPEGIRCSNGIVLGVSATEPQANVAITLSSAANENFHPTFWSIQP